MGGKFVFGDSLKGEVASPAAKWEDEGESGLDELWRERADRVKIDDRTD